uniref:Putative translation elongation factor ef-1 alpha/tu n=1 Tax=Aedes aegypti TaxID=7159 RepID=A0A0P6J4B7_AEDAE
MSRHRRNTLVVDFSTLPKRPALDQVEEFLKHRIKLDMADVKSIQLHHLENCVFIEMNNASLAPRLHKQHHLQHSFVYEGRDYFVPVYVDGPNTVVKIHDLPPQMSNTAITNFMQQYGKVISIQNDVWKNFFPGVPNGVRVLRMKIEKPLPSYVAVDGHRSYISFPKADTNQQQRTPSGTTAKSNSHVPSTSGKENTIKNNNCDAPSVHSADDSSETDDDDGNESNNDDDGNSNSGDMHASETIESTGKRRLSTETNSDTREDNVPKRSCSQGSQKVDTEWKVYQTRSKKK